MELLKNIVFLLLCCIINPVKLCKTSKSSPNIERSSTGVSYTVPNVKGYCSIDDLGRRHEHCRCTDKNERIEDCKKKCDTDVRCKGYSFRATNSRCYLYTTSSCSSKCTKRNAGNLGNLIEKRDDGESGCFRKMKGASSTTNNNRLQLTSNSLKAISEELLRLDTNNVGRQLQINTQGKARIGNSNDRAPNSLFTRVDNSVWRIRSFRALQELLDNYDPDVRHPEDNTRLEREEEEEFLTSIMETKVIKRAYKFLVDHGKFTGTLDGFRTYLKRIWFGMYDRDGNNRKNTIGSSGFEHVFIGEVKKNAVSGFHNWVSFYQKEKLSSGRNSGINYLGYIKKVNFGNFGSGISNVFTWNGVIKKHGSMFVGTSPELEMALYTICFLTRKGQNCNIKLNNVPVQIKTSEVTQGSHDYIGTAYPSF